MRFLDPGVLGGVMCVCTVVVWMVPVLGQDRPPSMPCSMMRKLSAGAGTSSGCRRASWSSVGEKGIRVIRDDGNACFCSQTRSWPRLGEAERRLLGQNTLLWDGKRC